MFFGNAGLFFGCLPLHNLERQFDLRAIDSGRRHALFHRQGSGAWIMKKTYEKPVIARKGNLSAVSANAPVSIR